MNVAIIGCSFSDVNYNPNNWTELLAKKYPTINFWNYSKGGRGHLYQDMCLKHALFVEKFDYIIVQCTGRLRWQVPDTQVQQWEADVTPWDSFVVEKHHPNMYVMRQTEGVETIIVGDDRLEDNPRKPFRTAYNGLYYKQLEAFAKLYNLHYFSFPTLKYVKNNIAQSEDVFVWFENKLGEQEFIETCLDDTLHLNKKGNQILFEDYILCSNIKKVLDKLA